MIKSISDNQEEILRSIQELYLNGRDFECDITYGNGAFWKNIKAPELRFDITPLKEGVIKADSRKLPVEDGVLNDVVFDPPFLTYIKNGRGHNCIMGKRFGGYYSYKDLEEHYKGTLVEVHRVLKKKSILVMKCQDIVHNHKLHCTHANVINWGKEVGFDLVDMFILVARNRMSVKTKMNSNNWKQRHARIFHSYFLVMEKNVH